MLKRKIVSFMLLVLIIAMSFPGYAGTIWGNSAAASITANPFTTGEIGYSTDPLPKKADVSIKKEMRYAARIGNKQYFLLLIPAPAIHDPICIPASKINDDIFAGGH